MLRKRKTKTTKKVKEYTPPPWFTKIKPGSHGFTPHQKRLWRVVSEKVRKRDFELYGTCVSCGRKFETWEDSQAGHYKAWAECDGFFRFDERNIFAQCHRCNMISDGPINEAFRREIERRHGPGYADWISRENQKHVGEKLDVLVIVGLAAMHLGHATQD